MWAVVVRGFAHLGTVAWCSRCGAYAFSARVAGLAAACPLRPVSVGAEIRLRRLRRRQHPLTKLELTEPERLRFSGDALVTDADGPADGGIVVQGDLVLHEDGARASGARGLRGLLL